MIPRQWGVLHISIGRNFKIPRVEGEQQLKINNSKISAQTKNRKILIQITSTNGNGTLTNNETGNIVKRSTTPSVIQIKVLN